MMQSTESTEPSYPWDAFALLLAGERKFVRIADLEDGIYVNNYATKVSWPAEPPAAPYIVPLTDGNCFHAIALDFDTEFGDAQPDALKAQRALSLAGARVAAAHSGPSGGMHLLLRLTEPMTGAQVEAFAKALKAHFPSLDPGPLLNVRSGSIRPPGSAHRDGGRSSIVGDPGAALRLLEEGTPSAVLVQFTKAVGSLIAQAGA